MKIKNLFSHRTKYQVLLKFLGLLAIFVGYFVYLSLKFDFSTGVLVSLLTWSFFVLATPVADAGFLLDFPIRLVLGVRMFVSEIFVWVVAIAINIVGLTFYETEYDKTFLTSLLKKILANPYPYWVIIILSGFGTFLSIKFGDELLDVATHKERIFHHKHTFKSQILIFVGVICLIFFAYYHLLDQLGVSLG